MGRHRKFDEQQAIKAIEDLFWEKGYEATTYADLIAATGLGKGSLYAAFGNKHDVYLKALEGYVAREVREIGAILTGAGAYHSLSVPERIEGFLNVAVDAVAERQDRRGCFICNAAIDLAPFDPDIEKIVLETVTQIVTAIGELLAQINIATTNAEHLFATYLGMRVMAKAGAPVQMLESVRDSALKVFH